MISLDILIWYSKRALLIIAVIIFILAGIALIFTGIRILLKQEITITSRNSKYLILHPFLKALIPGAYDPVSFRLRGWKKTSFGLLLLILGCFAFIASWQMMILTTVISHASLSN